MNAAVVCKTDDQCKVAVCNNKGMCVEEDKPDRALPLLPLIADVAARLRHADIMFVLTGSEACLASSCTTWLHSSYRRTMQPRHCGGAIRARADTKCDDGDECTLDRCEATGCVNVAMDDCGPGGGASGGGCATSFSGTSMPALALFAIAFGAVVVRRRAGEPHDGVRR